MKRQAESRFLTGWATLQGMMKSIMWKLTLENSMFPPQAKGKYICSFVPNVVQPSPFVTFIYHNCDHNPETLSGISLHCKMVS